MSRKAYARSDLLKRIAIRQSDGAVITGPAAARWNASGRCQRPVYRELVGWTDPLGPLSPGGYAVKERSDRLTMEIEAPCRKCPPCLRARAALWRNRALVEMARSARSWFGTLTLKPDQRVLMLNRARSRLHRQGLDFDALPDHERFRLVCDEINKELTLFFKRVRKNSGAKLRYCAVHEAHKDGFPHVHLMLHEREGRATYRVLTAAWPLGFSKFNLVDGPHVAAYVTKYLAKSMQARVRASVLYGSTHVLKHSDSVIRSLTPSRPNHTIVVVERGTDPYEQLSGSLP